jgi:hypothetical protein
LWLDDDSYAGIRVGADFPLAGNRPAAIISICPGESFDLVFPDGRRAVITFSAINHKSEIAVTDHGADGLPADALATAWTALLNAAYFVIEQAVNNRAPRQAVIVIHGIGSQRPLSTVKGLAAALVGQNRPWSKPDLLSSSYELRRYQPPQTRNRPRTDFYELYWADKVPGTKLGQTLSWLRPRNGAAALRPAAYLTWSVVVLGLLTVGLLLLAIGVGGMARLWDAATGMAQLAWVSAGLSLIGGVVNGFLVASLGDAARYLEAAPDNISVRQSIRQNGVALLRRLHEEGSYDRIAVVGHSLGSVIGYDIIRLYWAEVHTSHGKPPAVDQPEAAAYERSPVTVIQTYKEVEDYRARQRSLWSEYRRHGHPWLITDFVSVGSPLAHAETLLARSPADLSHLVSNLELPTCPPYVDPENKQHIRLENYLANGKILGLRMLTHGAPFAVTRWTNIYVPARGVIFGDPIGGPLAPVFGHGIKDVPVTVSPWWRRYTPLAHTSYWQGRSQRDSKSVRALAEAIDLESKRWLPGHIKKMPWSLSVRARSDSAADLIRQ